MEENIMNATTEVIPEAADVIVADAGVNFGRVLKTVGGVALGAGAVYLIYKGVKTIVDKRKAKENPDDTNVDATVDLDGDEF